ncbi:hypothetical protein [Solicola sp. PLA-1-18]|uniref:hypothetical protein n=1 Tax=Solicola sp. PLA-1-18 TaxID=3380532 RepID=UPI003B78C478
MGLRRWVLVPALVLAVAGCGVVSVGDDDRASDAPSASARSVDGGTETWDLRVVPSAEAFGRADGKSAAVYQTREPRDVSLLLPQDRTLTVPDATLVDFKAFGPDRPERWSFGVTTAGMGREATVALLGDLLDELGLPAEVAAEFDAASSTARTDDVSSPFQKTRLGELGIGVRATWAPRSERGTVDVAGDWGAGR